MPKLRIKEGNWYARTDSKHTLYKFIKLIGDISRLGGSELSGEFLIYDKDTRISHTGTFNIKQFSNNPRVRKATKKDIVSALESAIN